MRKVVVGAMVVSAYLLGGVVAGLGRNDPADEGAYDSPRDPVGLESLVSKAERGEAVATLSPDQLSHLREAAESLPAEALFRRRRGPRYVRLDLPDSFSGHNVALEKDPEVLGNPAAVRLGRGVVLMADSVFDVQRGSIADYHGGVLVGGSAWGRSPEKVLGGRSPEKVPGGRSPEKAPEEAKDPDRAFDLEGTAKGGSILIGRHVVVGREVHLTGPVLIESYAMIGDRAMIDAARVGRGAVISADVTVKDVSIAPGRFIKPGMVVDQQEQADLLPRLEDVPESKPWKQAFEAYRTDPLIETVYEISDAFTIVERTVMLVLFFLF